MKKSSILFYPHISVYFGNTLLFLCACQMFPYCDCFGQLYSYKIITDDLGNEIDTLKVLEWPSTTPETYYHLLSFTAEAKMRFHGDRLTAIITPDLQSDHMIIKTRSPLTSNVAIYHTKEYSELSNAVLYRFGQATSDVSFIPEEDGYYLILTDKDLVLKSYLYKLERGMVTKYKPKICEPRIDAFPANPKKVKRKKIDIPTTTKGEKEIIKPLHFILVLPTVVEEVPPTEAKPVLSAASEKPPTLRMTVIPTVVEGLLITNKNIYL